MKLSHLTGELDVGDGVKDRTGRDVGAAMTVERRIRRYAAARNVSCAYVVFGSSTQTTGGDDVPEGRLLSAAIRHVAAPGAALVNGGYMGTMADTAARVRAEGGISIGVPCGNLSDSIPEACFDTVIPALDHWERIAALTLVGDAFLVLPGGIGTATEVAALLWNADRGFVRPRPVLFFGEHWRPWLEVTVRHEFSLRDRNILQNFHFATTVPQVDAFFDKIGGHAHV